jgi:hypothetical protein
MGRILAPTGLRVNPRLLAPALVGVDDLLVRRHARLET